MKNMNDFEHQLAEANRQIDYYKRIAKQVGDIRLREIEQMSQLILKLRSTEHALQESLENLQRTQNQLVESEKNRALTTLVAGVAHEINTPVGICITAASHLNNVITQHFQNLPPGLLQNKDAKKIVSTVTEATDIICANLARAATLIRSFKMVAVDQSQEEQREFNLKEYLKNILKTLHPEYKRTTHTINLNCPDNLTLKSFPGIFSQIITNLVMNSLMHGFETIENGIISIDVSTDENQLHLLYRDNGKGMNQEDIKKIFTPFFTTKRGHGGTGLGMHIIYNLVTRKLGGEITCENNDGKGISFLIKVPLTPQT